jgi:excisionase family DNA binding protein
MSTNIKVNKVCEYCGESFIAKTTVTRYCSHKCNSRHYKQRKREEKLKKVPVQNKIVKLALPEVDFGRLAQMEFLSIKEATALLGVSERTIYRLMKSGDLETKKIGRRTIITRSAIDKLLNPDNHE